MQQSHIPPVVFSLLFIFTIPLSFDNFSLDIATSVVPGWHTTIFPPYFLMNCMLSVIMLLVTLGYFKISKKIKRVDWMIFSVHVFMTIPAVFYIAVPFLIDNLLIQESGLISLPAILGLIITPYVLFMIGQVFFGIYYARVIKEKPVST